MNPTRLALLAAFDALLTIAVGIAVPLVPLTILWAVHYGAGLDWLAFLRASADIWLLGNGVQFTAMIDSATAATLGVSGVEQPFKVTLAPLAFAFVSVLVGIRVGHRAALGPFRLVSVVVPIAAYAVLSTLVTVAATHPAFVPTLWTGVLVPPAVFGAGVVGGFVVGASVRRDGARRAVAGHGTRSRFDGTLFRVRTVIARVPRGARAVATTALVAGLIWLVDRHASHLDDLD